MFAVVCPLIRVLIPSTKLLVMAVFTGPISNLLGFSLVPVSMKFSMNIFSPKSTYLKFLEFSMSLKNCGIRASDLVSGTSLFCCQYVLLLIFASGSNTSIIFPLNIFFGNGSNEYPSILVLRMIIPLVRKSRSESSATMSSCVSTHSPSSCLL